jgi:hypothetical protein
MPCVAKTLLIATSESVYPPSEIIGVAEALADTFLSRPNANRRAVLTLIPSSRSIDSISVALTMPLTLEVKSDNAQVKADREAAAQRVIACLAPSLPESRTLCFLDDEDPCSLKRRFGTTNRGISGPIHDNAQREDWPEYVWKCVFFDDRFSWLPARVIDDLVYL